MPLPPHPLRFQIGDLVTLQRGNREEGNFSTCLVAEASLCGVTLSSGELCDSLTGRVLRESAGRELMHGPFPIGYAAIHTAGYKAKLNPAAAPLEPPKAVRVAPHA